MSGDEALSRRYDEWSAHMTADIAFYVGLVVDSAMSQLAPLIRDGEPATVAPRGTRPDLAGFADLDGLPGYLRPAHPASVLGR